MLTKLSLEYLKESDHSEDLGVDGRIMLKWVLGKLGWRLWIGFIWLRTGTEDGLL
jgi:hypothetical protein